MSNRPRRPKQPRPQPAPQPAGTTVIRMTTAAQMVAAMPLHLGYPPRESLVVMCCHEPRGRMGLLLRIDLPAGESEAALAEDVVRRVRHQEATRVVLMIYTEEPDGEERARAGLMRRLTSALSDLTITEALLVRDGRFFSYTCTIETCCPSGGKPVDLAVESSAVRTLQAEKVGAGQVQVADREALVRAIAAPELLVAEVARQRCEQAQDLLGQAVARSGEALVARGALEAWDKVIARFAEPPATLTDQEAAALVVSLELWRVRDALAAKEKEAAEQLITLLHELCRRTPAPHDVPLCTLLGWVTYCEGGGTMVTIALERALATDPGYGLAKVLDEVLRRQVRPDDLRQMTTEAFGDLRRVS